MVHNQIVLSKNDWDRLRYRLRHIHDERIDEYFRDIEKNVQIVKHEDSCVVVRTNLSIPETILARMIDGDE